MIPFDKIPDLYRAKAKEYAPAFAQAKLYKEHLKQLLAVLMTEHLKQGESAVKAEALAKCDIRYTDKLKELQKVLLYAEVGRGALESLRMAFDYHRSSNALERSKINLI